MVLIFHHIYMYLSIYMAVSNKKDEYGGYSSELLQSELSFIFRHYESC